MPTSFESASPPNPAKIPGVSPALGYLTLRELAQVMHRNVVTLFKWRDRSRNPLPVTKLGRLPVVFVKDLESWFERERAASLNGEGAHDEC